MDIKIIIEPVFSFKWPMVRISINDKICFDGTCEPNDNNFFIYKTNIDPIEKNNIQIEHYDKKGEETVVDDDGEVISDRALILKSIILDDFNIPEVILYDRSFRVNWTTDQLRENKDLPKEIKNNLYFGHNGTYRFEFGSDSAREYYLCLLEKERIANVHNKKEMRDSTGKLVEVFEFTGRLVDSNEKDSITIDELHQMINNEI